MSRNWWTFVAEFQPRPTIIAGGLYYGGQWGVGRKPLFIIALFVTGLRCRSILLFPYLICIDHIHISKFRTLPLYSRLSGAMLSGNYMYTMSTIVKTAFSAVATVSEEASYFLSDKLYRSTCAITYINNI